MISHKHMFIFVHIPKCGGTTLEKTISDGVEVFDFKLDESHKDRAKILPFGNLRMGNLGRTINMFEHYSCFTFVRNPYRRLLSTYLHLQRASSVKTKIPKYFDRLLPISGFDDFVESSYKCVLEDDHTQLSSFEKYHLLRQSVFFPEFNDNHFFGIKLAKKFEYDFVGRVESFDDNINFVLKKYNLSRDVEAVNRSSYERPFREYFSSESIALTLEIYKEDFLNFNYSLDISKA